MNAMLFETGQGTAPRRRNRDLHPSRDRVEKSSEGPAPLAGQQPPGETFAEPPLSSPSTLHSPPSTLYPVCEGCSNLLGAGIGVGAACRFAAVGNDRVGWNLDRMAAGVCGLTMRSICKRCRREIVVLRNVHTDHDCALEYDAGKDVWFLHRAVCH